MYKNKEDRRKYDREWKRKYRLTEKGRQKNKENVSIWRSKNIEKSRKISRDWSKTHRKQINKSLRKRYKEDPVWKLQCLLRSRIKDYESSWTKGGEYREFLGCSFDDLKIHIESLFQPGMSWDNHGKWHIDHIIPLSLFAKLHKEKTEEIFDLYIKDAFHYTNLQPMWAIENLLKGNRTPLLNQNT